MNTVTWAEALEGIGAILAVIVAIGGYIFVIFQIRQASKSIQHSSSVAIYSISSDFYKFLADNSHLRPFFYDNRPFTIADENKDQIFAVCEYLADFFEFVLIESKSLDPRIFESWIDYMQGINANSPAFRIYLEKYKQNYTEELTRVFAPTILDSKPVNDHHSQQRH